jgi:rhamnosyltransferase subunit B
VTVRRYVLTTYGTLGDLHPYLALGIELHRRGQRVRIVTCEYYRKKVTDLGLEFAPMRPDAPNFTVDRSVMRRAMAPRLGSEFVVRKMMMPHLRESFDDLMGATADADLLLTHPLVFAAPIVGEIRRISWVSGVLQPIGLFSCEDPPVYPNLPEAWHLRKLGIWPYRFGFSFMKGLSRLWGLPIVALRKNLGLSTENRNPLIAGQFSPFGTLGMFSRHFSPPAADWPQGTKLVGFPFFDESPADLSLSAVNRELQSFIDRGNAPVIFTLGSAAAWDPQDFYAESAKAAAHLGLRAILAVGRETGTTVSRGTADLFVTDYVPYGQVFPQCAAVVHHGGIGTTGQVLASGRPAIVIPFAHDQFDNAMRAVRLGIARTVSRRKMNSQTIAAGLAGVVGDPEMLQRAQTIGKQIRSENGAVGAADYLQSRLN